MAGTIVTDRIESDASYASRINVASEIQFSNTITGNVNIDSGLIFVDAVNNRVGVGTQNPIHPFHVELTAADDSQSVFIRNSSNGISRIALVNTGSSGNNNNWNLETGRGGSRNFAIRDNLGTGEVFRIDNAGRVTIPNQPLFQSYINSTLNFSSLSDQQVLPFNTTSVNQGSHYNTSTYRFTAPIAGKYSFSCYMRVDLVSTTSLDYVHPYWAKNGANSIDGVTARMILTEKTTTGADYNFVSSTIIANLAANDYIELRHGDGNASGGSGGSAYYQGNQCWMNGFLIG